jgi:polyisoprenoid-binding protein YceI
VTSNVLNREFSGLTLPAPGTFVLDPAHTTVSFVARHLMVSKVRGSFGTAAGTVTLAENPVESTVEATIDAASITTGVADRDGHLRGPDFLDVERFPTLTFRSLAVEPAGGTEFVLVGELTIRDVTRPVRLNLEFEGATVNPWGKEVVGFSASTEIDREDFGITWNKALESGGVLVGRKVKIEISAEAVRQA